MDILYLSLVNRLQQKISQKLWIDLEAGQLESMDKQYPIQLPAVFIDLQDCTFVTQGQGLQYGDMNISLRVAFDVYKDFHGDSPDVKTAGDQLKLLNQIHNALHLFNGNILPASMVEPIQYHDNHFTALTRTNFRSEQRADGLRVFSLTYTTTIRDTYAMRTYTEVPLDDVVINKQ